MYHCGQDEGDIGHYVNSVLPAQFCCESEATLKSFKRGKKKTLLGLMLYQAQWWEYMYLRVPAGP